MNSSEIPKVYEFIDDLMIVICSEYPECGWFPILCAKHDCDDGNGYWMCALPTMSPLVF